MSKTWLTIVLLTSLGSIGCTNTPAYLYGEDLTNLQFKYFDAQMGVYPDTSILKDPNNPFAHDSCTDQVPADAGTIATKWVLQGSPATAPVVAFYCWATLLAQAPNGEDQWYVGNDLQAMVTMGKTGEADIAKVKLLGVAAYQSVLDNFPTAVTYDSSGKIPTEIQTSSYTGIIALGGMVTGGWELITDKNGVDHAVRP
jgi:hypothetical protein